MEPSLEHYKDLKKFTHKHGRSKTKIKRSLVSSTVTRAIMKKSIPFNVDIKNKDFVNQHGKARYEDNVRRLGDRAHNNDWNDEADTIGVLGELAFEKLTGIPMDKRIDVRDPYDFKIEDLEIDVKATESSSRIPIKRIRLNESDKYYYVYVKVNLKTFRVEFVGCLSGDKVKQRGYIPKDDTDIYYVDEENLDDMKVLYDEISKRNGFNRTGIWI